MHSCPKRNKKQYLCTIFWGANKVYYGKCGRDKLELNFSIPFSTALKGYVQVVHEIKKSMNNSSNSYFDIDFQVAQEETKVIRVMTTKSDISKCQLLLDKCNSEQAVQLSNIRTAASGTIFMTQGTTLKDLPAHSIHLHFNKYLLPLLQT